MRKSAIAVREKKPALVKANERQEVAGEQKYVIK